MRYLEEAAGSLHDPQSYIRVVLTSHAQQPSELGQ
jgi:hypothetical protein